MDGKTVALEAIEKIETLKSVLNVAQVACSNRLEVNPEGIAILLGLIDDYYLDTYLQELQEIIDDS